MWLVSDAYKKAVVKQSRKWKAEARVTYKNREQVVFTDETIMDGITVSSQMVSGDEGSNTIDIGAVPEKKIELTLIDTDSDLHRYDGARLSVNVSLELENGEYEEVPMGVFFVDSSATTRLDTNIKIVGYDGMVTFQYNLSDYLRKQLKGQTAARAAQILASRSSCGFSQDLSGFPNSNIPLNFDSAQVVTGWDGIMWIAQIMGCFGRINRRNYLEFVPIKFEWEYFDEDHTSGRIVETRTIQDSERYDNTTFSDDRMHIVGVAMPDSGKYITSGGTGGNEQDANIMILLEKNPIIVNSGKSTVEILDAIRQQLWSVCFYAFKIDIENDPALDAGDVVRLKGGVINGTNKNNDLYGFITHNEWHYQGRQTITSTGQTPIILESSETTGETTDPTSYLQPKSQSEKLINALAIDNNQLNEKVTELNNQLLHTENDRAKYLQTDDGHLYNPATALKTLHEQRYSDKGGMIGYDFGEQVNNDYTTWKSRITGKMQYQKVSGNFSSHPVETISYNLNLDPSDITMNNSRDKINFNVYGHSYGHGGFYAKAELVCDGLWVPDSPLSSVKPRVVQLFYANYINTTAEYKQEFVIANIRFTVKDDGIHIDRPGTSFHFDDSKTAFIPWSNVGSSSASEQSETRTEKQIQTASVRSAVSAGEPSYTYDDDGIHISYNGHTKVIPWDT